MTSSITKMIVIAITLSMLNPVKSEGEFGIIGEFVVLMGEAICWTGGFVFENAAALAETMESSKYDWGQVIPFPEISMENNNSPEITFINNNNTGDEALRNAIASKGSDTSTSTSTSELLHLYVMYYQLYPNRDILYTDEERKVIPTGIRADYEVYKKSFKDKMKNNVDGAKNFVSEKFDKTSDFLKRSTTFKEPVTKKLSEGFEGLKRTFSMTSTKVLI